MNKTQLQQKIVDVEKQIRKEQKKKEFQRELFTGEKK